MALSFGNATVDAYSANLVSLWNTQETSGTRDDMTTGNRDLADALGYYGVGSTTGPDGVHNAAVFSGYYDWLYYNGSYPSLTDFTLSCWVYGEGISGAQRVMTVGNIEYEQGGFSWGWGTAWGGGIKMNIAYQTNPGGGSLSDATSAALSVSDTVWYHLAVTRSGSTLTWYLDGVSQGTTSASQTFSGSSSVYMGCRTTGEYNEPMEFMYGNMTQLVVWNTALSGAALTALYNSGDGLFDVNDITYRYDAFDSQRDLLRYIRTTGEDAQRNTYTHSEVTLDA